MRLRAISLALSFAAIGSAFAPAIRADQLSAEKKAAAETLFEDGKRLKKEGNFLEAARKFEQVQKLDPGIGTLLHLAESYERAGFFASAWGNYKDAAELARKARDSREKLANDLASKLVGKLARLRIDVGPNESIPGLVVSRGGIELDAQSANVAIPVDPGKMVVVVRAPEYDPYREEISVQDAEQKVVSVPPLVRRVVPPAPAPQGATAAPAKALAPTPSTNKTRTRLRYGALSLGLGALAGSGVAVGFALRALKLDDDAAQYCTGLTCSDPRGESLSVDALHAGSIATTGLIVAGATGAGALGLLVGSFFAAPQSDVAWSVTPWLDGKTTGMHLGGSF